MTARYDAIADFYAGRTGDDVADPATAALLDLVGDVSGLRVLDLACGHGRVARELADRGARVVGIDVSRALLEKARAAERARPRAIVYVHEDVSAPAALDGEHFDAVVCNYGLSDIDDLDGALATVTRALVPGGRVVCSILHPCFPGWGESAPSSAPPGRGYYEEGWWLADNPGFRGKVGAHYRMLSTYLNAFARHGMHFEQATEPAPPPGWDALAPGRDPVPVFLVVRWRFA